MHRTRRHRLIITTVATGERSISALAHLTGASEVTVRRDLAELSDLGVIRRTRGGAAPARARGAAFPYAIRQTEDRAEKRAMAHAARALVSDGEAVFFDNGTTVHELARVSAGAAITAFTTSLHTATALKSTPGTTVLMPGGEVDGDDLTFAGAGIAEAIGGHRFDTVFLGACAADPVAGLTVASHADAVSKRAAIAAARQVVLLATPDKFTRTAAFRVADVSLVDVVVTTTGVPADIVHTLRENGVDVRRVDPAS